MKRGHLTATRAYDTLSLSPPGGGVSRLGTACVGLTMLGGYNVTTYRISKSHASILS